MAPFTSNALGVIMLIIFVIRFSARVRKSKRPVKDIYVKLMPIFCTDEHLKTSQYPSRWAFSVFVCFSHDI